MSEEEKNVEIERLKDAHLRSLADYVNMKNRLEKQILSARAEGKKEIMLALLPVLDTFMAAGLAIKDSGIELAVIQLHDCLAKMGLKQLNPKGEPFDYNRHEGIEVENGPEEEKGLVRKVLSIGYEYNGETIRHPKVVVSE